MIKAILSILPLLAVCACESSDPSLAGKADAGNSIAAAANGNDGGLDSATDDGAPRYLNGMCTANCPIMVGTCVAPSKAAVDLSVFACSNPAYATCQWIDSSRTVVAAATDCSGARPGGSANQETCVAQCP